MEGMQHAVYTLLVHVNELQLRLLEGMFVCTLLILDTLERKVKANGANQLKA